MNERSDIDRALRTWFEDGPTTMPDRVVDVVALRIGRQRQRRTWRLRRRPFMTMYAKLAAGAAAILIVGIIGWQFLPRVGGPGGLPTPVPTPTALATPSSAPAAASALAVACEGGTAGCAGRLAGGTYSSANFLPKLTFTVPDGPADGPPAAYWINPLDLGTAYNLVPPGGGGVSFQIVSQVAIPEQTADCTAKQKAGVGNAVADWVSFLTKHPGLAAEAPVPVTIGGFKWSSVHFARAASWTATCPNSAGPAVELWMHAGAPELGVQFVDNQDMTYWILDVAGETVLIHMDSANAARHVTDLATFQPIIDSFRFAPR